MKTPVIISTARIQEFGLSQPTLEHLRDIMDGSPINKDLPKIYTRKDLTETLEDLKEMYDEEVEEGGANDALGKKLLLQLTELTEVGKFMTKHKLTFLIY